MFSNTTFSIVHNHVVTGSNERKATKVAKHTDHNSTGPTVKRGKRERERERMLKECVGIKVAFISICY